MESTKKNSVKYAVVDAFTDKEFKGNPAAVCLLEEERENEWLQSVAAEFNLSETAYLIPFPVSDSPHPRFHLRWFTPVAEVNLCGHATLAAAHFCFTSGLVKGNTIEFSTLSGILTAQKIYEVQGSASLDSENGEVEQRFLIGLDFPVITTNDYKSDKAFQLLSNHDSVIDVKTAGEDLFVVFPSSKALTDAQPNIEEIKRCPDIGRGLIITAAAPPGSEFDFFSRFFAPKFGIDEDPVCGSAHCALAFYWAKKLGKSDLTAYAAAPRRSGTVKLHLDDQNNRVKLMGKAVTVMEGCLRV